MSDRLDRIENILAILAEELRETRALTDSNARAIESNSDDLKVTRAIADSNAKSIQAISNDLAELGRTVRETRLDFSETRAIADSNARAIEAGASETASLKEATRSLFASQERLTSAYIGFTDTVAQYIERTDRRLERLEN
jgi:pyruvate/2-oxoglutarate dehydrogenase complex dihydrolipoamide acyltransferase (E2) component